MLFLPRLKGGGGGSRASARLTVGAAAVKSSGIPLTATQHISDALRDNLPRPLKHLGKIGRKVILPLPQPVDTACIATAGGQPVHLFNGAGAMRSSVELSCSQGGTVGVFSREQGPGLSSRVCRDDAAAKREGYRGPAGIERLQARTPAAIPTSEE